MARSRRHAHDNAESEAVVATIYAEISNSTPEEAIDVHRRNSTPPRADSNTSSPHSLFSLSHGFASLVLRVLGSYPGGQASKQK